MLVYSPNFLFMFPGVLVGALGALLMVLVVRAGLGCSGASSTSTR